MDYTVNQLSQLSGVSSRTLRYYDQIGLLKPARITSAGYRIYNSASADRLLLILLYREFNFNLDEIKKVLDQSNQSLIKHLENQQALLTEHSKLLEQQLSQIKRTLSALQKGIPMSDQAKFENLKKKILSDNETQYGQETRDRYGRKMVEQSNARFEGLDQQTFERGQTLADQIVTTLLLAMDTGDPSGDLAQQTARLHKEWLQIYWPVYSPEAHAGLAQMYVDDERFTVYYDQHRDGAALFLRDAIFHFTGTVI